MDARVPHPGSRIQDRGSTVPTPTHRRAAEADADYPLTLIIGDVLFDRGAMTSRSTAIADLAGEPWALIHPDDARGAGVADRDPVVLRSRRGSVAVRAKLSAAILPGQVFLPRGYDAAPANMLADLADPLTRVRVAALVPVSGGSTPAGEGGGP